MIRPTPSNQDAILHDRLLKFGLFIQHFGEWGLASRKERPLCRMTYKYAVNAGRNLVKQATADYKAGAAVQIREYLSEDRIADISLILDELFDAENLPELLELIVKHKKTEL